MNVENKLLEGWIYKDMPVGFVMKEEEWLKFQALMGDGNFVILAYSKRLKDGIPAYRGQFLVSPEGMKNLNEASRAAKTRTN